MFMEKAAKKQLNTKITVKVLHILLNKIWTVEEMSVDWQHGFIIIPVAKLSNAIL